MWCDDLNNGRLHNMVSTVPMSGCYADYYGCLDCVGQPLIQMLLEHPRIWKYFLDSPADCLRLAAKFRHRELYSDAFRRMPARAPKGDYGRLMEVST